MNDSASIIEAGPVPAPDRSPRDLFLAALGFGLVVGWTELGMVLARRAFDARITMASLRTSRHFVWMIPNSDVLLFGVVGLLVAGLARFRPDLARWLAWRLYTTLAALAVLLAVEGLHVVASVVLACGLGVHAGPALERRVPRLGRRARFGVWILAGGLVVLTFVTYARVTSAERRALAHRPPAAAGAPNVLLIVLDNVRADSMSLYGHHRPTTPNLERRAREGIRFVQARSTAPWTLPSHASMFTGQWRHKLSVHWDRALDATYPTLAEYLAGHGYATAGFVGNTYYCNARYGLDRGFARYEDYYENQVVSPFELVRSSGMGKRLLQVLGVPIRVDDGRTSIRKTAEMLNRDVLGWLATRPRERPFFVFLNYFDAHAPFIPPDGPDPRFGLGALPRDEQVRRLIKYQKLMNRKLAPGDGPPERIEREATEIFRDSYESCIAYIDRCVGQLFDALERRGWLENTLVIVTSDHGEHFREHGFHGHGLSLYRREVHVPLLIFPPSGAPDPQVIPAPVSLRELPATIVELIGLGARTPFPGRSLARFWRSKAPGDGPLLAPVLSEVEKQKRFPPMAGIPATLGPVKALLTEERVYIRNGNGREELYDVRNDPLEMQDLAQEAALRPSVQHFRRLLDQLLVDPS